MGWDSGVFKTFGTQSPRVVQEWQSAVDVVQPASELGRHASHAALTCASRCVAATDWSVSATHPAAGSPRTGQASPRTGAPMLRRIRFMLIACTPLVVAAGLVGVPDARA